ncbi:MAG: hypothetical protein HKN11_06150 [Rhizobiales bacterium]|nr:hypothetical protein [Hyphomicrobiales bacterium]
MSEFLSFVTARSTIISIAILGAIVSLIGGYLTRRPTKVSPKTAKLVLRGGYAISWTSVAAFIVAGFMAD